MDVSSVGGAAFSEDVKALYAIQCMKMSQESTEVLGNIIQDTAEISDEAMAKLLAELEV